MSEPRKHSGVNGGSTNLPKATEDLTNDERRPNDGINYSLEGGSPPKHDEERDPTAAGYDEAAHRGPSMYGVTEGDGGVFGTTGGGTYPGGGQVIERPGVYDRGGEPASSPSQRERHTRQRDPDNYESVNTEEPDER